MSMVMARELRVGDEGRFGGSVLYGDDTGPILTIADFRPAGEMRFPTTVSILVQGEAEWRVLPREAIYEVTSR